MAPPCSQGAVSSEQRIEKITRPHKYCPCEQVFGSMLSYGCETQRLALILPRKRHLHYSGLTPGDQSREGWPDTWISTCCAG